MLFNFKCVLISDSDADFMSIFGVNVTFAPNESEKRITIQTNSDDVVENTEEFSVTLSSVSGRVVFTNAIADIAILETSKGKKPCLRCLLYRPYCMQRYNEIQRHTCCICCHP